jgi:cobyric acid synthase
VQGTHLHGLFANAPIRRAVLTALVARRGKSPDPRWGSTVVADRYDRLAEIVAVAVDMPAVAALAALAYPRSARAEG